MLTKLEEPLTRFEATLVNDWLKTIGKEPTKGWLSIWRMTPARIAAELDVKIDDILKACRRK